MIPFQTIVNMVDVEDIANDMICAHDFTREVISFTNRVQAQNMNTHKSEQLMFKQLPEPNNKKDLANKKDCTYCQTNESFHFFVFQKAQR